MELSESPVTPAYDTNTDSSEHFLSFGSSSGISCSPWNTLGRGPVAQGLMGPQVIVEPEVSSQFPSGL